MSSGQRKPVFWCKNCVAMSTRPRIGFDERGYCNACVWGEKKKTLDWDRRLKELERLLDKHRRNDGTFDCLAPVSGGKDGSYVSYQLKHKYGMNPLTVTVTPPLALPIGEENLKNFIASGYNHVSIDPAHNAMRLLNRAGFIEMGSPYFGWLTAILSAPVRTAVNYGISLMFYGEDGEVEYGGSTETDKSPIYGVEYMQRVYLEGGYRKIIERAGVPKEDMYFFQFPNEEQLKTTKLDISHWSYFENWDPYRNYLVAKEHCGLKEADNSNSGTFTNFAQNDQALYALHTYLMYLKFGFGRANQDACIEVRRGAMDREQAVNLIRLYDGQYPEEFMDVYLDYFRMTRAEFDAVLERWTNKDLFEKRNGVWEPNFSIE